MIAVLPSMIHPKQPFSDGLGDYLKTQKKKSRKSCDLQDSVRRERDSNPRYLSVRRFSRPVHSTTLPSLLYLKN